MRRVSLNRQSIMMAGLFVILAALPLALGNSSYTMRLLVVSMIWGGTAVAWDLLLGYAGIFNLGQIGFFAVGAYSSAMLSQHLGVTPWVGLVAGALAGALVAVLIGLPCLRLTGIYVALLTLAFYEVLAPLLTVGIAVGTGGKRGLSPLAPYSIGGYVFPRGDQLPWYYVAFALFVLTLLASYLVVNSKFGTGFIALRDSEAFAQSLGVSRYRSSLLIVGISGLLTGMLGAFYAHYAGVVSPRLLGLEVFVYLVIMVLLGGVGKFPGAAIGAFVITFANDWLRRAENWRLMIFGALVVLIVLVAPRGLMGAIDSVERMIRRRRADAEVARTGAPEAPLGDSGARDDRRSADG